MLENLWVYGNARKTSEGFFACSLANDFEAKCRWLSNFWKHGELLIIFQRLRLQEIRSII